MARADLPALDIGAIGNRPIPPQQEDVVCLGIEHVFLELAHQRPLQIAEDKLAGREWFFEHFTAVDAHFFWCFRRGSQFDLDLSPFKNCMAHFGRMKQWPSVRKLLAYEEEVQTAFAHAA